MVSPTMPRLGLPEGGALVPIYKGPACPTSSYPGSQLPVQAQATGPASSPYSPSENPPGWLGPIGVRRCAGGPYTLPKPPFARPKTMHPCKHGPSKSCIAYLQGAAYHHRSVLPAASYLSV